jgi:phosphoesterase RecJ-like protein
VIKKSAVPPIELLDFIREGEKFLIVGHKEPDGDCLGSQFALASALRRMGKEAVLCSAGPFKRIEVKRYEPFFTAAPDTKGISRAIVIDCSSIDRTGGIESYLEGFSIAIIDHHDNRKTGNGESASFPVCYIDSDAPSTTFMVMKVMEALGLKMNLEEAESLFFGLCTDTGFFRHVDNEGAETFEAAAALIRAGANPKDAFSAIYGGKSLDSRKLIGHILLRAEPLFDGKLVFSSEEYEETCRYGYESRDSDILFQLFQSVDGVEAIVIIRQETPENCTIAFRSRSWVDVGSIAESFGGGGHMNASGCIIPGSIAELKPRVVKAFEKVFS